VGADDPEEVRDAVGVFEVERPLVPPAAQARGQAEIRDIAFQRLPQGFVPHGDVRVVLLLRVGHGTRRKESPLQEGFAAALLLRHAQRKHLLRSVSVGENLRLRQKQARGLILHADAEKVLFPELTPFADLQFPLRAAPTPHKPQKVPGHGLALGVEAQRHLHAGGDLDGPSQAHKRGKFRFDAALPVGGSPADFFFDSG